MGASSNPGSPTSQPAPCLWLGKAAEDGPKPWEPASAWETWKRFLVPSFGLVQHRPLRESPDGKSSSLPLLLSVYLTLQ